MENYSAQDLAEINDPPKWKEPPLYKWKADLEFELQLKQMDWTLSLTPWERLQENDRGLQLLWHIQEGYFLNRFCEYAGFWSR